MQSPNSSLLLGQWEMTSYGADTNRNGLIDSGETTAVSGFGRLLVFDGYGFYNAVNIVGFSRDTVRGEWALEDNGNMLRTVSGTDTARFTINTISKTSLILLTQATGSDLPYWQVFKKN